MESNTIKRIIWTVISLFILSMGFLLCRYAFFNLHGMIQFPFLLFVFGLIVICIAAVFNGKIIMISTALGYTVSFFIGVLFQTEWIDSHGTIYNNLWIWWELMTLFFVCVGVTWEMINKKKKLKR